MQRDEVPIHHVNKTICESFTCHRAPRQTLLTSSPLSLQLILIPNMCPSVWHPHILSHSHWIIFHLSSSLPHTFVTNVSMSTDIFRLYFLVVLCIGLYKTSTLTTCKEVLFISFLSRWQKPNGGGSLSVWHNNYDPEGHFFTSVTRCVVKHFNSNYFTKYSLKIQDYGTQGRLKQIKLSWT
jgi:hypothetical protein